VLEVSTKSDEEMGRQMSAFNLKVQSQQFGEMALECAFPKPGNYSGLSLSPDGKRLALAIEDGRNRISPGWLR